MIDRMNQLFRKLPTWVVYSVLALPIPALFYMAATGQMGEEPVRALEHEYGEIALKLLIAGLAVTPLRRYVGLNLLKFRRALGLMAFAFVVAHLGVWVVLDMALRWSEMWADIWKRPYITIGMVAFVGMVPLAITSTNRALRKMGPVRWRKLHKLTYGVAVLAAVHFIMVQKVWEVEPLLYLAVIAGLLALRYKPSQNSTGVTASS